MSRYAPKFTVYARAECRLKPWFRAYISCVMLVTQKVLHQATYTARVRTCVVEMLL